MADDGIGRYATGELIFREGDPGTFACLLRSGLVEIYHPHKTEKVQVATVKPGQLFGELALFDGGPRMAAARALTAVEVHRIDRATFVEELDRLDEDNRSAMQDLLQFVREVDPYNAQDPHKPAAAEAVRIATMRQFLRGVTFGHSLATGGNDFARTLGELLIYYANRRLPPE